ncbi:hypothetical protein ACOMHN_062226 [Nucella lapillus]
MVKIRAVILSVGVVMLADGLRIKECGSSGWFEIQEDKSPADPITCDQFPASANITWTLSGGGEGPGLQFICGPGGQSCTPTDSNVTVSRTDSGTEGISVLTVVGNPRTTAGNQQVTCNASGSSENAKCSINVFSKSSLSLSV